MNEGEKRSKRGVEIVDNVWRRKKRKKMKKKKNVWLKVKWKKEK